MRVEISESQIGQEPVDLSYVKNYLKVDFDVDDKVIIQAISAARGIAEKFIGQSLMRKRITAQYSEFNEGDIENGYPVLPLWRGPATSVEIVKFYDENGTESTLTASDYKVMGLTDKRVLLKKYVAYGDSVGNIAEVQYLAGMSPVPDEIKDGICQLVGDMYENRQNEVMGMSPQSVQYSSLFKFNAYRKNFGL